MFELPKQPIINNKTQILVYFNIAGPTYSSRDYPSCPEVSKLEIQKAFQDMFESWHLVYSLSNRAALEYTVAERGGAFLVGVRLPVEVWSMIGLHCGWRFQEIVMEE